MKKVISSIAALAIASSAIASVAFAANAIDFSITTNKGTYDPGEEVAAVFEVTGNHGFNGFVTQVDFDVNALELVSVSKTKKTDWDGSLTLPGAEQVAESNQQGWFRIVFFNAGDNGFDDDEVYKIDVKFKVKDAAAAGKTTIQLVEQGGVFDQTRAEVKPVGYGKAEITIKGTTPTPTPTVAPTAAPTAEVVQAANGEKAYGDGFKTVGLNGYVIPNKGFNSIGFVFSTGDSYIWDLGNSFTGESQVTYGLNIIDVPANETIVVDSATAGMLVK